MKVQTKATKQAEIQHLWHLVDVKEQTLGRIATVIAEKLMGKTKPQFVRNLDCGDYVVVTNAALIKVTGRKEEQKVYARHSGYPGGFRSETLKELRTRKPEEIIMHAVKGMLPDNRLRATMLTRLFVFSGSEHPYNEKFVSKGEKK